LYGRAKPTAVGKELDKREASAYFYFPKDPGYIDTARIVGECGLCFVFEKEKITRPGGMWTPSSCFGDVILDRLVKSGSEFEFIEREKDCNGLSEDSSTSSRVASPTKTASPP
jgi:short subunit dehydrogenase-like uncharacterized protein